MLGSEERKTAGDNPGRGITRKAREQKGMKQRRATVEVKQEKSSVMT